MVQTSDNLHDPGNFCWNFHNEVAMEFICKSKDSERKLYYSPSIGRKRIYRSTGEKHFKLKVFKNRSAAQALCDKINETYNDDFEVVEKPVEP